VSNTLLALIAAAALCPCLPRRKLCVRTRPEWRVERANETLPPMQALKNSKPRPRLAGGEWRTGAGRPIRISRADLHQRTALDGLRHQSEGAVDAVGGPAARLAPG